ncbi:MAG: hypothetical protein JWL97_3815 [Gemmatimonadales bacterium]|jgi:hypothetical protein|nr:hypothetical protein [Gemmatimonadales bacterium]
MKRRPEISEPIVDLVRRHRVATSLLVPGFVDLHASPQVVTPFPRVLFLGGDHDYLSLSIDEISGQFSIGETANPSVPNSLLDEPTIQPIFVDLSIYHLSEVHPIEFESASLYLDQDSSEVRNLFRAIAFNYGDGRVLLFDPFWPFGIRVGNEADAVRLRDEMGQMGRAMAIDL